MSRIALPAMSVKQDDIWSLASINTKIKWKVQSTPWNCVKQKASFEHIEVVDTATCLDNKGRVYEQRVNYQAIACVLSHFIVFVIF